MDWKTNGVSVQPGSDTWVAGPGAWLLRRAAAPLAWSSVRLEVEYQSGGGGFYINLDPWYIGIEEAQGRVTLSRYLGGNFVEAWDIDLQPGVWNRAEVEASGCSVSLAINGRAFQFEAPHASLMTAAGIYPPEGAQLRPPVFRAEETGDGLEIDSVPKSLEFTVDFYDDLIPAPFTSGMLDEMFRIMARLGGSQAYWIHHGAQGNGFWEGGLAPAHMKRGFELLGPDFLAAAVEASHRAGLPLIGIFKPFDTAVLHYTSQPPRASSAGRALGGGLDQGFSFPGAHPELCQQRRRPPKRSAGAREITLRSRRELPEDLARTVQLFTSADNAAYTPYAGPLTAEVHGRELRLGGLETGAEFLAILFPDELAAQLENTLPQLAEVRDAAGEPVEVTCGIASRVAWLDEYHLGGHNNYRDFRTEGINFDCAGHGVPSAVWNARKPLLDLYSPAASHNVLGLALNANSHVPAVLSEAEPGARAWWLSEIESMLDTGVDGIEIRVVNHSNIIDWSLYGFNPPLIAEYQRRYGVDIAREEFDREKFRALRGEFFTWFLREASSLTRARGRRFHLHIEDNHQGPPGEPCPMEIAMPWRQWIEEDLCDGVTLKALNVWANDSAFGREVIALCRVRDIPVSFSAFIHSAFNSSEREEILRSWQQSRYDAFNVYEFATLFEFTPEGEAKVFDQRMIDWLESQPWKSPASAPRSAI